MMSTRLRTRIGRSRRGNALLYAVLSMGAMFGVISLAVDWGRVQIAQTQLQATADAAARYAVTGLKNELSGQSAARSNAAAVCAENKVDGTAVAIDVSQDVEIGVWNTATRTFTVNNNVDVANAVRVTLRRTASRGNPIPLTFGPLIGRSSASIEATSIAMMDFSTFGPAANLGAGGGTFKYYIPATSNPWLSGAPAGTAANNPNPHKNPDYAGSEYVDDGSGASRSKGSGGNGSSTNENASGGNWATWGDYAPKKGSPIKAGSIPIVPGSTLSFDSVNGGANNQSSSTLYTADGNLGWIVSNLKGNENGIANLKAPINSVVAVFLNDNSPVGNNSYPPTLDFSTTASRDYLTLSPQLRQPFFVGDGRRDNGEVQRIIVPAGATRMFIGTMDGYEWNNNVGGFDVTAHLVGKPVTVK